MRIPILLTIIMSVSFTTFIETTKAQLSSVELVVVKIALCLCLCQPIQELEKTASSKTAQDKAKPRIEFSKEDQQAWTDATTALKERPEFAYVGEYTRSKSANVETDLKAGQTKIDSAEAIQVTVQGDNFYLSVYQGGLPGAGWDGGFISHEWAEADTIEARLKGFRKIDRSAKPGDSIPPQDAIVLFDGAKNKEHWASAKVVDGLLQAGAKTKKHFTDFKLHFETVVPYKPDLSISHPWRGNSGVFALGCYEIQVCDTFGLDLREASWQQQKMLKHPNTASGSIYGIRAADVNMALPPLSWESFDVDFTAARFDEAGKKTSEARITVAQNGVKTHDNVALPRGTGGGPKGPRPEVASGAIYFQSHGNPNQFRNVWIVEKKK